MKLVRVFVCLLQIAVLFALPFASKSMSDEGNTRAGLIMNAFARMEADYKNVKKELDDIARVDMDVSPSLLMQGEQITLHIQARSEKSPNPTLLVNERCYDLQPKVHTFLLKWKKSRSDNTYTAVWNWKPKNSGNYLLRWKCDIGGDIPEFSRNFAVIDNNYAVMVLDSTSHREPRPEHDFHELHLPFSPWWFPNLCADYSSVESFAALSRSARQYGDDPAMMIFGPGQYIPESANATSDIHTLFSAESEETQRAVLSCCRKLGEMFRFPRPITSFLAYGQGNGPVAVARSLGYEIVGAICSDQNWQDGHFTINHWGAPARPYFISKEDFRKPGDGGPSAMVGVPQCERQTMLCRDYDCVYALESGISYHLDNYSGITRRRIVDDMTWSREKDFFDCFMQSAGQTEVPLFFSCGVEFNGVWPDMAAISRDFMEYLVKRARDTRVVYCTATAVADFYRRHYTKTPESVLYLVDVFVGMVRNEKPVCYPDTMEIENEEFKSIFKKGETLPIVHYDYTTRWNYPDWGNSDIPRRPSGYLIPDTPDRYRVTPPILDTRQFSVSSRVTDSPKGTVITLEVDAKKTQKNLTLAVWDLPRQYSKDIGSYKLAGAQRFIPVRASYTQNLCGIIVANVKKGNNKILLTVNTKSRLPKTLDMKLSGNVMAKVIERAGKATAYLYNTGSSAEDVTITPPAGLSAKLIPFETDEPVTVDKPITITIEPGKCQRLVGLTYDQLENGCPGGSAKLLGNGDWTAGSPVSFEIEYMAGPSGIPVGGGVSVAFLHAFDIIPSTDPDSVGYVKVMRELGEEFDVKYIPWPPKMWPPTTTFPLALDRKKNDHNLRHGVFAKVTKTPVKPGEIIRFSFGANGKGVIMPIIPVDRPIRVVVDLKGDGKYYAIDDVPDCRTVAGPVNHFFVTVPSTRTVGEDADICIRAEDASTNVATSCNMRIKVSGVPGLPENLVQIKNGLARVIVPASKAGVFRAIVTGDTISARSSPMVVSAKRPSYNVYWGDIHGHTSLSDGLGPDADYYYSYARDAADLDVCASAEHEIHLEARESTRKFNEPGKFVTIWGYEWAESVPGRLDRNIYFRDEDGPIPEGWPVTIEGFWKSLEKAFGDNKDHRVIVGPHMFTYKTVCRPWYETWDSRYERFAEVYSEHGMSEYHGNPRMLAGGNVQENYFVQDGLKYGRRFGIIGSSDNHDSHPGRSVWGPFRGGLVAFLAKDLTRESIWDAFWNRRVYAATTERIYIDFEIDDHVMGEEFKTSGKPKISYTVHGCDDKFDVFLIKNNNVIKKTRATDGVARVSFVDDSYDKSSYYYLRVVQDNGEWAWSSPIWVDKTR